MATMAQLLTAVATQIETDVSGATRLGSDYRNDLEAIALGATRYQLQGGPAGVDATNSNVTRIVAQIQVQVHHRLASPTAERTYTEGAMQTTIDGLTDPATWRALAEVYAVVNLPSYEVERVVNIISTSIDMQLSLAG